MSQVQSTQLPQLSIVGRDVDNRDQLTACLREHFDISFYATVDEAQAKVTSDGRHVVVADVDDFIPLERALAEDKASLVLNTIGEGVCVLDRDGRCSWSNRRMKAFTPEIDEHARRICQQAMRIFASQTGPIDDPSHVRSKKFTFQEQGRYFEMICSPMADTNGQVTQVVAVVWDGTSGRRLQGKIDTIDAAGREMARIDRDAVMKRAPSDRLKLLQEKIVRFSKDLMHFDHFAIRLLDRRKGKLELVIAEGLPAEALEMDLYAQPEGNGITGYVASTGRSYICHDTEKDPRYVIGLEHSHSSLTVPLMLFDEVIGVYNVESESIGAFDEDDRQFAEIFGRYVAQAVHLLDLLVAERSVTSGNISDTVVQEMAQPLNDIVTEAQTMIEEYIGEDQMRDRLNRIIDNVQSIRQSISDVAAGPNAVIGAEKTDQQTEGSSELAGKRILVADDEPNIRTTIRDVLRKQGAEVCVCGDGYEACTEIDQQYFDLIISDIKMPYRSGYEIFAASKRRAEDTPVLLMTGFGYDPNHSIVRADEEGLNGVLFKPFKVDQLIDQIQGALHGAEASAPVQPQ